MDKFSRVVDLTTRASRENVGAMVPVFRSLTELVTVGQARSLRVTAMVLANLKDPEQPVPLYLL
jgi:hypothetical protein